MTGRVVSQIKGPAQHFVLSNEARKNALSIALLKELRDLLSKEPDAQTRVIFIRGAGGIFSAGADLNDITGTCKDVEYDRLTQDVCQCIRACCVPVIALIEGPCMGAAVELALSCDIRLASDDARFQVPATRLGLLYKPAAIAGLRNRLDGETLMRLLVVGEKFSARAALQAGLVGEVVAAGGLDARAAEIAENCALSDPIAAALTRKLLHELETGTADMAKWQARYTALLSSKDRKAAVAALKSRLAGTTDEKAQTNRKPD